MIKPNRSLILAAFPTAITVTVTWDTAASDAGISFTNSNLTATSTTGGDIGCSATLGRSTGKWFFELRTGSQWSGGDAGLGMLKDGASHSGMGGSGALAAAFFPNGSFWNGTNQGDAGISGGSAFGANQTIGFAVDLDNNRVWFTKNGTTWSKAADPTAGTNFFAGGWTTGNTVKPALCMGGSGNILTLRAKSADFSFTPPTGFSAWQ